MARTSPPTRVLSSSDVPSAITLPTSMTAILSASRSTSSRYWVVRRIVVPSSWSSRMMSHISIRLRGSRPVVGPAQLEAVEDLDGPSPRLRRGQVVQPADHLDVLQAGEVLVHRRGLTGQADDVAERLGVADDVEPGHLRLAVVGREERGQDPNGGGLAGAVRPEEPEHGGGLHGEVHALEGLHVPERLPKAFGADHLVGHPSILAAGGASDECGSRWCNQHYGPGIGMPRSSVLADARH